MGNKFHYKTFEEWCLENNRYDILELWDYDRNEVSPSDVPYGTKKRYYFKCPNGVHESESKIISNITDKPTHKVVCLQCNGGNGNGRKDLTWKQFGELTVLRYDDEKSKEGKPGYWICQCSCNEILSVFGPKLREGKKKICGKAGKHKYQTLLNKQLNHTGSEYYYFKKAVKEKNQNICIISGEQLDDNEVHHILSYAKYPEYRYDVNNGACITKRYHSITCEGSFHRIYGTGENNTPENFQKYVNEKRRELGITDFFDVFAYLNPYEEDNLEIADDLEYIYC